MTPEEIIAAVGPAQGWADGTVKTLINRLLRKKAIAGAREATGYYYRPLVARSAYVQAESQGLLDRLFGGEVAPMVAHFAEHRTLTPKDIEMLRRLIAEMDDHDA